MPGYYTVPPLGNTNPTSEKPLVVKDFLIGRKGHGEILFPGETDLTNIDLSVVSIGKRYVTVYPRDTNEPPVGCELNKSAIVTLQRVWPRRNEPTNCELYRTYLQHVTKEMGAEFIDYLADSGSWVFRVPHFSKYGLNDSDEEADVAVNDQNNRRLVQVPGQTIPNGVDPLKIQNGLVTRIPISIPLDGEETIPKRLLYEPAALVNEMDGDFNQEIDPRLRLFDELNYMNRSDVLSPNRASINFGMPINNERLSEMKVALFEESNMEHEFEDQRKKFRKDKSIFGSKTIFFESDYMEEEEPLHEQEPTQMDHQHRTDETSILPIKLPGVDHSRDLPVIQPASVDSPIFRTPRKFTTAKHLLEYIPYSKSLLFSHENILLDAGCFKNASFRIGWGPKLTFVHKAGSQPQAQGALPAQFSLISHTASNKNATIPPQSYVHCSKLDSASVTTSAFHTKQNLLENLLVQLNHHKFTIDDNNVPLFCAEDGVELLNSHFEVSRRQSLQGRSLVGVFNVWNLCTALWGHNEEDNPNSYNYNLYRKELFSQWLVATTASKLEEEVRDATDHLTAIFSLMTGNRIEDACNKAYELDDLRLGLLLSQTGSFSSVRNGILKQMENWFQFEVDRFIDEKRMKIYALLAGRLVWKMQQGTVINCCEDLDWKRSLSLHLWYNCLPTYSIQEALSAYEESFQGSGPNGQYAFLPYPPYIENDTELHHLARETDSPPFDMCYHILKLYCDRSTPLGKLLAPLTYGPSQLDHSLSWMVYQVLLSLGYQHLPFFQSHLLHVSFSSQLEAIGLWEWAIFVLLHITESLRRKAAVMEVLVRHISLHPDEGQIEIENFLKQKLHIPSTWIYAAKAILAKALGRYRDEAWCLLKSEQWTKSHQIIVENIAPDCVIHEQFDYLKSFLVEMSNPDVSSTILDWSTGGEVYLDYIYISEQIEQLMSGQIRAYEIEKLQPKVVSLSNRICNLQCLCAKDRLCQSEMSKKTVTLFRALLALRQNLKSGLSSSSNQLLSSLLPKLPMPEDYALQEMKATVRSYMLEVTNAERDS